MDLFIDNSAVVGSMLEKLGEPLIDLGEDPSKWPNIILAKFFKRAPYASSYDVTVDLVEVNPENLTAFGQILIKTKTFRPSQDEMDPSSPVPQQQNKSQEKQKVTRAPVIISQGKLYPIDLLMIGGKLVPFTASRLEQALFRPDLAVGLTDAHSEQAMSAGYNSPSQGLMGRGATTNVSKLGSVATPIMDAILPTVKYSMTEKWAEALNKNSSLKHLSFTNPAVLTILDKLASVPETKVPHTAYYAAIPETTTQFYYDSDAGTYCIKQASCRAYHPVITTLDRKEALRTLGPELVKEADKGEAKTVTTLEAPNIKEPCPQEIVKPGYYRVRRKGDGKDVVGYVFTDVRNMIDGEPSGLNIFTNGSQTAIQGPMMGHHIAAFTEMPVDKPTGSGVFYQIGPQGGVTAYGPVTIKAGVNMPDGTPGWIVGLDPTEEMDGSEFTVIPTPDIIAPSPADDETMLIPDSWQWASLGDEAIQIVSVEDKAKLSHDASVFKDVELICTGSNYTFRGPIVEKLAQKERQDLNYRDAAFLGGILGFNSDRFAKYAEEAKKNNYTTLKHCLPIKLAEDVWVDVKDKVKAKIAQIDFKCDLLKEASFVPDPVSVDAMLSLEFITPENIQIFVSYKNHLEEAINRVGQLLMASRLGMDKQIPAEALIKAMRSLDKVVIALERLSLEPEV